MGFFLKRKKEEFRRLNIGEGKLAITIPCVYLTEMEDDLLLIYPPGEETITLRVAVLSVTKDGISDPAYQAVLEEAHIKNLPQQIIRDEVILLEQPSYETSEQGVPIIIQVWRIGYKTSLLIITSTTIKELSDAESVKQLLTDLPVILKSITEK